jgi:hypothetical protein
MDNTVTKYLSLAIDILFLRQPTRTSLGLIFGMALRPIIKLLAIWAIVFEAVVTRLSFLEFGLLGLCLAHIPTAWSQFFGKKNYLSENEEKAFAMIRDLKLTEMEKQQLYLRVVEKVLEKTELKPEIENEIKKQLG